MTRDGRPTIDVKHAVAVLRRTNELEANIDRVWAAASSHLGEYAEAGIPCYVRVELDPLHVVAYRLDADGIYEEVGRAEPGEVLKLTEPFPITIDPAALVR